jgi:hypothetical protein
MEKPPANPKSLPNRSNPFFKNDAKETLLKTLVECYKEDFDPEE